MKKTRARRKLSRTRKRRTGGVSKSTKAYVKKAISRKLESKMVQYSNAFYNSSEDNVYNSHLCYSTCSVGVTDRGRIGNSIYPTKIVLKYKIQCDHTALNPVDLPEPQGIPTIWFNMFLIKQKSNFGFDPPYQWFKAKDRGSEFPTLPLSFDNVQDGKNTLNTDAYTVIKMKKVPVTITLDHREEIKTGSMVHVFKKLSKMILNENSTNVTDAATITPVYYVIMYPYWGKDSSWGGKWGFEYSIQCYYKD